MEYILCALGGGMIGCFVGVIITSLLISSRMVSKYDDSDRY